MKLAPVMDFRPANGERTRVEHQRVRRPGAHETQVAWRQVHFAAKPAPQHRGFAAGKVEVS